MYFLCMCVRACVVNLGLVFEFLAELQLRLVVGVIGIIRVIRVIRFIQVIQVMCIIRHVRVI